MASTSTAGAKTWKLNSTRQWFNTAAFSTSAADYGYYGTATYGTIMGPGQELFNASLFKQFRTTEHSNLEFRSELFNLFNHSNPGNPNVTVGSSTINQISSTSSDPRMIVLSAKFQF